MMNSCDTSPQRPKTTLSPRWRRGIQRRECLDWTPTQETTHDQTTDHLSFLSVNDVLATLGGLTAHAGYSLSAFPDSSRQLSYDANDDIYRINTDYPPPPGPNPSVSWSQPPEPYHPPINFNSKPLVDSQGPFPHVRHAPESTLNAVSTLPIVDPVDGSPEPKEYHQLQAQRPNFDAIQILDGRLVRIPPDTPPVASVVDPNQKKAKLFPEIPWSSASDTPLRICPKRVALDYATDWYFHTSTPKFLICSNCFAYTIKASGFAQDFVKEHKSEGESRLCMFHVLRVKDVLWPQVMRTRDLQPLVDYMSRRSGLKCPGTAKNNDTTIKYYSHKNKEPLDGFIYCEACYEDTILGKPFASDFDIYPVTQTAENFWACDGAIPSVQRAFDNHNDSNAWIAAAKQSIGWHDLPICPAARSAATPGSQWYKATKFIKGFFICETCYYDRVVQTPFTEHFEFAAPKYQTGWSCDFSAWSISMAWDAALLRDDYDWFWNAVYKIRDSPFCALADMQSDTWYSLEPRLKDFNVCPACYEGIFRAYDCGTHLVPRIFDVDEVRPTSCSMWREGARGRRYINKYGEALDTLSFSKFANLVTAICSSLVCPRDGNWTNREWYGYPDALFCDECYRLFVQHTTLAKEGKLPMNFEKVEGESFCSIYSPRMREKWLLACSTGDVEPFLDFARHRKVVHDRTAPEVMRLLQMMQMRQMMSLSMGMMTMMTHAGDSISNMAGSTSETWDVTTGDGFHGTGGSEIGAQRQADFERSMARASGLNEMSRANFLDMLWKQVE